MHTNIIDSGYYKVSELHELYYEVYGNPNGIPVLFLHGGPGSGFSDGDKLFFDPKKFKVLFFDQRGAAKSKPFGCVEENTTQDLVEDIKKLLKHLNFSSFHVFGGSWGSTLALVYAIQNPANILSLCLRGIFTGSSAAIDHFVGGGIKNKHPKIWERFSKLVPAVNLSNIGAYYLDKMLNGSPKEVALYTYEWAFYELSIFKKEITGEEVHKLLKTFAYQSLSIMEAHYMANNCFLADDYILNNIHKIKHIPTHIIHGEYDDICPLYLAQEIHKKLPNATFQIVDAGHSKSEPEIEKALLDCMKIISA